MLQEPTAIIPIDALQWVSLDELIDYFEARRHPIRSPFTADERALARAVSEAHYFAHFLRELPPRAPDWKSQEFVAMCWGVWAVCHRRGDLPQSDRAS